jgi:hypothetical protein
MELYRLIRLCAFSVWTLQGAICETVVVGTDITSGQMSDAQIQLMVKASGMVPADCIDRNHARNGVLLSNRLSNEWLVMQHCHASDDSGESPAIP